jgi:hypothetical protein
MKNALLATTAGTLIEVWFQDEARVGQQGSLTYIWAPIGSRPRMVRDNRHDSAYLFGAICPNRGVGAAIIMPAVNTEAMNEHLNEISTRGNRRPCRFGPRRSWLASNRGTVESTRQHHVTSSAAICAGTEPDGERLGLSARQQTEPPSLGHL